MWPVPSFLHAQADTLHIILYTARHANRVSQVRWGSLCTPGPIHLIPWNPFRLVSCIYEYIHYTVSCLIYKKLGRIQNTDSDPYLFWLWSWIQKSIRIRIHLLGFWTFGEKNNLFTKHLVVKYMFVHVSTCTLYIDLLVYAWWPTYVAGVHTC